MKNLRNALVMLLIVGFVFSSCTDTNDIAEDENTTQGTTVIDDGEITDDDI